MGTFQITLRADPRGYGAARGQGIFVGRVREAFADALGEGDGARLRVLLFVEASELQGLRWERLCAPFAGAVTAVALTRDGRALLSGGTDGATRRWAVETVDELERWVEANRFVPELDVDERRALLTDARL